MGVKGLLQALQKCTNVSPLGQFKGKRIAIDASGWLHKGIFTAAEDFVDSNFEDYQLYVDWIINRLRNMRDFGIEPVLVFDGKRSVLKAETQGKREDLRQSNMESARRLISSMRATGDPACREKLRSEAVAAVQRGLGVSHDMEVNTIAALRKLGFTVIIAPYEADAQLAYLCHIGFTDAVMTEDSDILVYAAVSGKPFDILYKYEKSGVVQVVNLANIGILSSESNGDSSMDTYSGSQGMPQSQTYSQQISSQASANSEKGKTSGKEKDKDKDKERGFVMNLKSFRGTAGRRMFVQMCIMAGCDYIENIPSVGIATAQQAVIKNKSVANDERLVKMCNQFTLSGKNVPEFYMQRAQKAELLFHYHLVYNPYTETVETFMPTAPAENQSATAAATIVATTTVRGQQARSQRSHDNNGVGVVSDDVYSGPVASQGDVNKLGSVPELLRAAPPGITLKDICEGKYSYQTFQPIFPRLPWDNPKYCKPAGQTGNAHRGHFTSGVWGIRRALMQALGNGSSRIQSVSSSQPQRPGILHRTLPFSATNRAVTWSSSNNRPTSYQPPHHAVTPVATTNHAPVSHGPSNDTSTSLANTAFTGASQNGNKSSSGKNIYMGVANRSVSLPAAQPVPAVETANAFADSFCLPHKRAAARPPLSAGSANVPEVASSVGVSSCSDHTEMSISPDNSPSDPPEKKNSTENSVIIVVSDSEMSSQEERIEHLVSAPASTTAIVNSSQRATPCVPKLAPPSSSALGAEESAAVNHIVTPRSVPPAPFSSIYFLMADADDTITTNTLGSVSVSASPAASNSLHYESNKENETPNTLGSRASTCMDAESARFQLKTVDVANHPHHRTVTPTASSNQFGCVRTGSCEMKVPAKFETISKYGMGQLEATKRKFVETVSIVAGHGGPKTKKGKTTTTMKVASITSFFAPR